ncbi:MAG: tyrosine-type recombinase/integrase [Aureliella sp.]
MAREPGYRLHKPTGLAYVCLSGRMIYLGKHGTPESKEKYEQLKAEWLLNRNAVKFRGGNKTLAQVALAYLDHAEEYYAEGSEYAQMRLAIQPISELYPMLKARDMTAQHFKTMRAWWLKREVKAGKDADGNDKPARKCTRQYCNKQMKRLLRVIKWGVAEGLIPVTVYQQLKCVEPLKAGRIAAPEAEPVKPVDPKLVEATLQHLPRVVSDMVKFQMLTGCRPGEACRLTPRMVDRSGSVWAIRLPKHKTAHRGKSRVIYCGPKSQAILAPYLLRGADDHCFSPQEAQRQRSEARARNTPPNQGNRKGYSAKTRSGEKYERAPGTFYSTQSYGKAIKYACRKGKLEEWAPNQLRHLRATEIRAIFGLEEVASVLGHADITMSQLYAEKDEQRAIKVAMQIG